MAPMEGFHWFRADPHPARLSPVVSWHRECTDPLAVHDILSAAGHPGLRLPHLLPADSWCLQMRPRARPRPTSSVSCGPHPVQRKHLPLIHPHEMEVLPHKISYPAAPECFYQPLDFSGMCLTPDYCLPICSCFTSNFLSGPFEDLPLDLSTDETSPCLPSRCHVCAHRYVSREKAGGHPKNPPKTSLNISSPVSKSFNLGVGLRVTKPDFNRFQPSLPVLLGNLASSFRT